MSQRCQIPSCAPCRRVNDGRIEPPGAGVTTLCVKGRKIADYERRPMRQSQAKCVIIALGTTEG